MSGRVPIPNVMRCTLCQQILAVDVFAAGWDEANLEAKIAEHLRRKHPEEQR